MNFAELLSALEEVSGFIASAGDTRMLDTAAKIKGGLALRFPGYNMDEPMYAVRFEATRSLHVDVPDGPLAEVIGEKGLNPHLDPPFTGNGFTASADEIVSEYHIASGGEYPPGAEMWKINPDGSEECIGVLQEGPAGAKQWVEVGP